MKCALRRWLAIALFLLPGRSLADAATAEAEYRAGFAEFEKGNYDAACQAFARSYAADPLPGALFTLATCEMRAGRLATAAGRYQEFVALVSSLPAAQQTAQAERREVAERERRSLLRKLPHLKVVATAQLQTSATIKLDGAPLDPARLGVELPVDPGEHLIEVAAADGTSNEVRVTLANGEHKSVVLSPVGMAAARVETTRAATPPVDDGAREEASESSPTAAYVALGVGLVGVGVGGVAGMRALDHKSVVDDECAGAACSERGKEQADAGKTAALVSTIGFGVGAAGLTTALILFFTSSGETTSGSSRVAVQLTPRSVGVLGAF